MTGLTYSGVLKRMKDLLIIPNFFCSIPYWANAGAVIKYQHDWVWLDADDVCLFPPIPWNDRVFGEELPDEVVVIWSDFIWNDYIPSGWISSVLDYEFLYNPVDFLDISGGKWRKFRKNHLKWANTHDWVYNVRNSSPNPERLKLLGVWAEKKQDSMEDVDIFINYLAGGKQGGGSVYFGELYDRGKLVGLNVWDDNYMFLNYRFCIPHPDHEYMDEFLRWLFYTDSGVQSSGKYVNDGGSLGSSGLHQFKTKLNPAMIRKVKSYTRKV